jgi:hypothetical protein
VLAIWLVLIDRMSTEGPGCTRRCARRHPYFMGGGGEGERLALLTGQDRTRRREVEAFGSSGS